MSDITTRIKNNLEAIDAKIRRARQHIGLPADGCRVMAVSKRQPLERIKAALDAGHRLFGENRVDEAEDRWPRLREAYPDAKVHLIGSLQSRKVASAVALFDMLETIDRAKIARAARKAMEEQNREIPVLIQVNTGEEPQKGGVLPGDLTDLVSLCRDLNLDLRGLMCIPPVDQDPAMHFAFLAKLARDHQLDTLSMGMSGDYELAAAAGSNWVRIGTSVFGARPDD